MAEAEPGGDEGEAGLPASTAYVIEGGVPLRGTLPISGAKNAVLKLMAAAARIDEAIRPSRWGGEQRTISAQPASRAGIAIINTEEGYTVRPPGA